MKIRAQVMRTAVVFVVFGGIGFQLGRLIARFTRERAAGSPDLEWWAVPLALLAVLLVLMAHEAGHVLGGWMGGLQLQFFAVGPLRIERRGERLFVGWNRDLNLWGGIAAVAPPAGRTMTAASLRNKMVRVVAGGPAASLLGGLLCIPGLRMLDQSPNAALCMTAFGFTSLLIALATLIPTCMGGFLSDGARLLQLWKGGPEAQLWVSMAALSSLAHGLRPKHWPAELVARMNVEDGHPYDRTLAAWLMHSYHLDREEWEPAESALRAALAGQHLVAGPVRSLLHASAAYHYAKRGNSGQARNHWQQVRCTGFFKPGDLDAIHASVLASEGRREEALALVHSAQAALATRHEAGAEIYRELLDEVRLQVSA